MSDEEEDSVSEGFSASEDEWKPTKDAKGGESSDDDDSDFDELQAAGAAAGGAGGAAGSSGRSSARAGRKGDHKAPSGIKGSSVKKRKPSQQSLFSKLYNKYRPPPKTFPTSPSQQQNSPSASGSKNARMPNESGARDQHNAADSSSESSVEDYLVNPADLDLQSSFFVGQPPAAKLPLPQEKEKSPVPQFDCNAGITNLSDSGSGSEDNNDSSIEDKADGNAFDFRGLLENANSLERTRDALSKRNVTATPPRSQTATMDVNALLALGENQNYQNVDEEDEPEGNQRRGARVAKSGGTTAPPPPPPMDGPCKSKTKSTRIKRHTKTRPVSTVVAAAGDTDDSDFEEVAGAGLSGDEEEDAATPNISGDLEIRVGLQNLRPTKEQKTQLELENALKRRLNRDIKDRQLLLHKVSLMCQIARSLKYNRMLGESNELKQAALKLLPSRNAYPTERGTELKYLQSFVTWFKTAIKLLSPNLYSEQSAPNKKAIVESLLAQIKRKEARCKQDMIFIFIVLGRGMGMNCRLIVNLQPMPLRPAASDLIPVKMKPNEKKNKSQEMEFDSDEEESEDEDEPKKKHKKAAKATEAKRKESKSKPTAAKEAEKKSHVKKEDSKSSPNTKPSKKEAETSRSKKEDSKSKAVEGRTARREVERSTKPSLSSKLVEKSMVSRSDKSSISDTSFEEKPSTSKAASALKVSPSNETKAKPQLSLLKRVTTQKISEATDEKKPRVADTFSPVAGRTRRGQVKPKVEGEDTKSASSPQLVGSPVIPKLVLSKVKLQSLTKHSENAENTNPQEEKRKSRPTRTRSKSPKVHISPSFLQGKSPGVSERKQNPAPRKSPDTKAHISPTFLKADAASQRQLRTRRQKDNNALSIPQLDGGDDAVPLPKKRPKLEKLQRSQDSDEVFEPAKPVKKAPVLPKSVQNLRKDRRVVSTDDEGGTKVKRRPDASDMWVEVWSEVEEQWICIDLFKGKLHCVDTIRKNASPGLAYVFAFQDDQSLKDVTARYCSSWCTTVRKFRVEKEWLNEIITPYLGRRTNRDITENEQLRRIHANKPLPKSIAEFKDHPLYALERHLLKFQALYPPDAPTLGFIRGEAVYSRDCVHLLHSREIWLKSARVVKLGEQPYKVVKRPKWDRVSHPIHIRCRMEYFSETHETFLHYCDFMLSETATKQLSPPDRPICATIWRVVILQSLIAVDGNCFEGDTDEDLSIEYIHSDFKADPNNDFILHPKVLVGCMRIDTVFRAEKVPKLQVLLCCQDIELNFLNQPEAGGELPPLLKEYSLRQSQEISQTFLTVNVEDLQMHSTIYSRNDFSLQTELRGRVKCLDYGFLNMLDIVEPTKFTSYARLTSSPRASVEANFLVDKLRFNCGPYVIHTLLSSKHHWQEVLQQRENRHALMPKCLVVNRMQAPICFGQTGTVERIVVAPSEVQFYHFRSCYFRQELTFFIRSPHTQQASESSDSVHIPLKFEEEHRVQHLRLGDCCITLKMGKLSATQIYILVKGQIELISMVPYSLITEFRLEGASYEENAPPEHLLSPKERSSSFYQQVTRDADINMRLKLSAGGRGRTGDIPLKANNNLPWLVKVPTQSARQFISLWVRILREDLVLEHPAEDFQPQKILICIWPIFEICNRLSCDVRATENTSEESCAIAAKGGRWALNTATTHATEHTVAFQFSGPLRDTSESEYTLMLRTMDWHKFFHYDANVWTIENALHKLTKSRKVKWPLNDPEELRVYRELGVPCQNPIDVTYQTRATREFSCTLGLDVSAWGMFINGTGLDVSLCTIKEPARIHLKANSLEMLPELTNAFTLHVRFNSDWVASTPICLEEQPAQAGRTLSLRCNSFVDIVIVEKEQVLRLMLEYKKESDCRRVFKLRSKFVLTNFTDVALNALPLAMDHKETSTREEVDAYAMAKQPRSLTSADATKNCIGTTLEVFHDLRAKHNCDTAFVYFVCFSVGGHRDISIPIPLAIPFARRCFSLQAGRESIPLMITLVEKDNVLYLNVFRDTAPAIVISNNTNIKFIVAQTSASEHSNVSCTNSEFVGRHFEWNQLVLPHSKCYYTPPQMYANFPDVEFTMCNLSLAAYKGKQCGKQKIGWSKPVRTDKTWQKFLHIPGHGDVKVVVCDKHRVIRLNIYYIAQQLEFSVKDLRSRLTKPENSLMPAEEQELLGSEEQRPEEKDPLPDMVACAHFSEECETKLQTRIKVFIKSFVFSLQTDSRENDYLKTEVCNIYADDLMAIYDDDDDQRELSLQLPNLQVDNQLYSSGKYDFPVLLCAEKLYRRSCALPQVYDLDAVYKLQAQRAPVSLFTFVFYQDEMQLQSVRCQIPPFRVYIEDAYLNQLLEALVECEPSHCVYSPSAEQERILLSAGQALLPDQVVAQSLYISEPLRLNSFTVEPLSLLLSVHTSSRLYIALDHSPLSFSRYERQQILTVPLRFGQSLGLHYLSGAIFGAGWVVGSLEILGSPSGLARSFSTGLRDFVSMPVQGLFRGPWGFLVGVTQGSASLLRNVTAGTVNSVTKLAGSVARNLDRLTLDAEHIELTEARRRARPQGFADGLTQGLTGLGISLLGAVGGLAHHTLEARSSVGVIAGLTKGIVGAFTKPISGAAEMLALTGQGVLHTVGFNAMPQQVEPSITRNVALHGSSSRIWSYLPEELSHDQMLFFCEITLLVSTQLRPALVFLTSSVLAIMQPDSEDLAFASPVSKVDVVADREDPSKLYLSLKSERKDDLEGQLNYTNERIMKFLNASRLQSIANDSLTDLLQLHEQDVDDRIQRQSQCIFYIKPNIGEHLIHYLKVISRIKD